MVVGEVSDDGLEQCGLPGENCAGGCERQLLGQLQSIGHGADHQREVLSGSGDDPAGDGICGVSEGKGERGEFSDECAGDFGGVDTSDEFLCGADLQLFADGGRECGLRSATISGEDDGFEDCGADGPGAAFIPHEPAPTSGASGITAGIAAPGE